jgi:hypothetical protein
MTVSAVRRVTVDTILGWSGLRPPALDFSKLSGSVEAFELLVEAHCWHYLFNSNIFVATVAVYGCYCIKSSGVAILNWIDLAFVAVEMIFFAASRDTLRKYYNRVGQLLAVGTVL